MTYFVYTDSVFIKYVIKILSITKNYNRLYNDCSNQYPYRNG